MAHLNCIWTTYAFCVTSGEKLPEWSFATSLHDRCRLEQILWEETKLYYVKTWARTKADKLQRNQSSIILVMYVRNSTILKTH